MANAKPVDTSHDLTVHDPRTDKASLVELEPVGELIPIGESARLWATFPTIDIGDKIRLLNALNGPSVPISERCDMTIVIVDAVATDAKWISATDGEIIKAVRICFITNTGEVIASVGGTLRQAIARLLVACPTPWPDGLPVIFRRSESNNKRPVYSVTIDSVALAANHKK